MMTVEQIDAEQHAFEEWAKSEHMSIRKDHGRSYSSDRTNDCWFAWITRAELAYVTSDG